MNCLIKDSEYRTKLALSGIPEFTFYAFASLFVEEHGRFPNLDELPGSDSSLHLKDTIHVTKDGSAKIDDILGSTGVSTIEEAVIAINDQYTDLEVDITPLNQEALVDIQNRPSPHKLREEVDFNIDENPNTLVLFSQMFDKLRNLYGINLIPITDKELSLSKWNNVPDVKNVSAFVYEGNVYINTDLAKADAPIHEMTHILLGSVRFKNPELYEELISMADKFLNFERIAKNYPNRTLLDIYEEVFVEEVSKYLAGISSDLDTLGPKVKYELHYNINRLLDSVLMGQYSVKSVHPDNLYNMSLKQLAKSVGSVLLNPTQIGSLDDASLHRMLANKKSDLMKKGDLREDCV